MFFLWAPRCRAGSRNCGRSYAAQTPLKFERAPPDPVAGAERPSAKTLSIASYSCWAKLNPIEPLKQAIHWLYGLPVHVLKRTSASRRNCWNIRRKNFTLRLRCTWFASMARVPFSATQRPWSFRIIQGPRCLWKLIYNCKNDTKRIGCSGSRMCWIQLCTSGANAAPKKRRNVGCFKVREWGSSQTSSGWTRRGRTGRDSFRTGATSLGRLWFQSLLTANICAWTHMALSRFWTTWET